VLPRYPGTRVVLNYRNGEQIDPIEMGALWESGGGPDSDPGDWWLSLPAEVTPGQRQSIPDSDQPPTIYSGKVTNDLTDADGDRVIEVAGLTIRLGKNGLNPAGQRPQTGAPDGTLTIMNSNSNNGTAIVLSDGQIELRADAQTSIVIHSGQITLKTQGVTAKLDASKMDVS
jgi:hypothetical protein